MLNYHQPKFAQIWIAFYNIFLLNFVTKLAQIVFKMEEFFCNNGSFQYDIQLIFKYKDTFVGNLCWQGNLFGFSNTTQTYSAFGVSVSYTVSCNDPWHLPQWKQCSMPGFGPILIAIIIFGLLLIAVVSASKGPFTWKTCDTGMFTISNVVMTPYPAIANKNVTVSVTGALTETVSGGAWSTEVTLKGIDVQDFKGNTCDLIPNCPCPCSPGNYVAVLTLPVAWFALTNTYNGHYVAKDQNGKVIACIDYVFDIQH